MTHRRLVSAFFLVISLLLGGYVLWQFQSQLSSPGGAQRDAALMGADQDVETHWRTATDVERKEAASTILGELSDFKRGDFEGSLRYQSYLVGQRPTADEMRKLILQGYPQFAHFKSVKLANCECDPLGQHLQVMVLLTGTDNITVEAVYFLNWEDHMFRVLGIEGGRPDPSMFRFGLGRDGPGILAPR